MTAPVDLAAVEKACEAVGPESWELRWQCPDGHHHHDWDEGWIAQSDIGATIAELGERYTMAPQFGEFIALSRTAMPAMAAAIRAVLALHHCLDDQRWPECLECRSAWPCETVLDIAEHVQVTL